MQFGGPPHQYHPHTQDQRRDDPSSFPPQGNGQFSHPSTFSNHMPQGQSRNNFGPYSSSSGIPVRPPMNGPASVGGIQSFQGPNSFHPPMQGPPTAMQRSNSASTVYQGPPRVDSIARPAMPYPTSARGIGNAPQTTGLPVMNGPGGYIPQNRVSMPGHNAQSMHNAPPTAGGYTDAAQNGQFHPAGIPGPPNGPGYSAPNYPTTLPNPGAVPNQHAFNGPGYTPPSMNLPGPPNQAMGPGYQSAHGPFNPGQSAYPGTPQMQNQANYPGHPQPAPGYGAPLPNQPPQASQLQKQRIDPSQIPRPIIYCERIQYIASGHTVTMPPPASSNYTCVDEGCCNPRFIRPTLNRIPTSKDLVKQCGLPMAAIICPLAELKEDELPIPLVDFGPIGPLRCSRCRAYVNSFTKFIQGGQKYSCNICTLQNETPREYYCPTDQNGRRRDIQERAELCRGSVDYIVPTAYAVRPPQEPIFVFVLDVSAFAYQSSLVSSALDAIRYILPSLAQNKRKKIGIVTFDTTVHYYRMHLGRPTSICVIPDVEDPSAPLPPSEWLLSMADDDAQERFAELSKLILKTYSEQPKNQSVSGSALWSVAEALSVVGGRIILLQAGAPRIGIGKVTREENVSAYGTTKEVDYYTPEDNSKYSELAQKCAESHISLDIFSVGCPFASLADVGYVSELTGGRVYHLPQFNKELGNNQYHLQQSLLTIISRDCGYEAVLKVRCSAGLRVKQSYGSFYSSQNRGGIMSGGFASFGMSSSSSEKTALDEMEFSIIDQDRSICVTFAHDENLSNESDAYIQAALLYTRSDGIRCVRVHNLALPVDNILSNVFRFADLNATCSVWQRIAAQKAVNKSIMRVTSDAIKTQLMDDCVNALYSYRKHCASSTSSGQLILPESLKLLPLYTLSTLKSRAFRTNLPGNPPRGFVDVRVDERVMMLNILNSLPVEYSVSAVYPSLYSIHDMPEAAGSFDDDGNFILPTQLPPTAEKLQEDGIFLLHSVMFCYLYIGPTADSNLLIALFGTDEIDTSEVALNLFAEDENNSDEMSFRARVVQIVGYLNSMVPISQPLEIITRNDWRANRFMSSLVEDRTRNDMSYVEFLVQVHKRIQYKFQ